MAGRKRKHETVYVRDLAGWWYYRQTGEGFELMGGRHARPIVDPVEQDKMQRYYRDATNDLLEFRMRGIQERAEQTNAN